MSASTMGGAKYEGYYVITWDPSKEPVDVVRKRLVEAFRKAAKRVLIRVVADDVKYMEQLREVLAEFISQTIVVERVR